MLPSKMVGSPSPAGPGRYIRFRSPVTKLRRCNQSLTSSLVNRRHTWRVRFGFDQFLFHRIEITLQRFNRMLVRLFLFLRLAKLGLKLDQRVRLLLDRLESLRHELDLDRVLLV